MTTCALTFSWLIEQDGFLQARALLHNTDKCAILIHPTESQKGIFQEIARLSYPSGRRKKETKEEIPVRYPQDSRRMCMRFDPRFSTSRSSILGSFKSSETTTEVYLNHSRCLSRLIWLVQLSKITSFCNNFRLDFMTS
jgi:hypothetical protein